MNPPARALVVGAFLGLLIWTMIVVSFIAGLKAGS